jgi:hypothetical protein
MTLFCGRLPLYTILPLLLFAVTAQAQHNVPLTLAEAEDPIRCCALASIIFPSSQAASRPKA